MSKKRLLLLPWGHRIDTRGWWRLHRPPVPVAGILRELFGRDHQELRDRWRDEASEAALAGNPARAHYIESFWCGRPV
jgi:hypothetical protein